MLKVKSEPEEKSDLFQKIVELSPVGVTVTDEKGEITYANREAETILGLRHDTITGRHYNDKNWQIVDVNGGPFPDDQLPFVRVKSTGKSVKGIQHAIISADGEERFLSINAVPQFNSDNDFTGIIATIEDITARIIAERTIKEEQEKAERYLDIANTIIIALDAGQRVTLANKKAAEVLGCPVSEILGKNWFEHFLPPETTDEIKSIFNQLLAGDVTDAGYAENAILTKSGDVRIIGWHNTILRNEAGELTGILSAGEDITEIRRAHEQMQDQMHFLQTLIDTIPNPVYATDANNYFTLCNQAFSVFMGRPGEAIIGKRTDDLLPKETADQFTETASFSDPFDIDIKRNIVVTKDGSGRILMLHTTPLNMGESSAAGVIGSIVDITRLKKYEKEVSDAYQFQNEIFNNAVPTAIYDADYTLQMANDSFCGYFQVTREQVVGKKCHEFSDKKNCQSQQCILKHIAENPEPVRMEIEQVLPDGTQAVALYSAAPIRNRDGDIVAYMENIIDITTRKKQEEKLQKNRAAMLSILEDLTLEIERRRKTEETLAFSEKRFQLAMQASKDCIWDWDIQGNTLYLSDAWREILGIAEEHDEPEAVWKRIIHPDDISRFYTMLAASEARRSHRADVELKIKSVKNGWRIVRSRSVALSNEENTVYRLIGTFVDITDRKEMEVRIREALKFNRTIIHTSPTGIMIFDTEGRSVLSNAASRRMLGMTENEMKKINVQTYPPFTESGLSELVIRSHASGRRVRKEIHICTEKKREMYFDIMAIPIQAAGETRSLVIGWDVSARRTAENALRASEAKFKEIFQFAGEGIIYVDKTGVIREINRKLLKLIGLKYRDVIGISVTDLVSQIATPAEKDRIMGLMRKSVNLKRKKRFELAFNERYLEINASYNARSGYITGLVHDITGRRMMEKQLETSENHYRLLAEHVSDIIFLHRYEGVLDYVSPASFAILGYKPEELQENAFFDLVHPDDVALVKKRFSGKIRKEPFDYRLRRKDGVHIWVQSILSRLRKTPNNTRILNAARNITAIKEAQMALRENEAQYRALFNAMLDAFAAHEMIFAADGSPRDYRFLQVNPAFERMTGLAGADIVGKTVLEVLPGKERKWIDIYGRVVTTGVPYHFQEFSGELDKLYECVAYPIDRSKFAVIFQDITERERAARKIKESEEKFRTYVTASPTSILIVDEQGRYVFANPAACELLEYTEEELLGKFIGDIRWDPTPGDVPATITALKKGDAITHANAMRTKSGRRVDVLINSVKLSDQTYMAYCTDITELRQIERILERELLEKQMMLENMSNAFLICEPLFEKGGGLKDCRFSYVNDASRSVLGVHKEQLTGRTLREVWPDTDPEWLQRFERVVTTGKSDSFEQHHEPTGKTFFCIAYKPLLSAATLCIMLEDVTEKNLRTRQLQEYSEQLSDLSDHLLEVQENERASIARELHDEMGQALTILNIDLVHLLNEFDDNHELKKKFTEMRKIIAMIDESMENLQTRLRPGMLDDLGIVAALDWQLNDFREKTGITATLRTQVTDEVSDRHTVTTIFRIVQEALTNVVRHADAETVKVRLYIKSGHIVLKIQDDGCGMSSEQQQKRGSFGLMGMKERVTSCDGKFVLHSRPGKGTRITVRLPLNTTDEDKGNR